MNLAELAAIVADENKAIAMVEAQVWPNGPVCPHCGGTERIYKLEGKTTRPGLRKCGQCRKPFTVRMGTIFEDSHLPLGKWLLAIHLMCSSKKGISANQLKRELGINYKSAWFVCHRVREAMKQEPLKSKLGSGGGIVEIDETWIGGKVQNNRHSAKTGTAGKKTIVMTLIERAGEVRTVIVPDTKRRTLYPLAQPIVDRSAVIMTDANRTYRILGEYFAAHNSVDHNKEYVRGIIHTNFAESYHSLLKRGLLGAFHHVSQKHLPRYLAEFQFRWNSRKETDGERTIAAIKGTAGKRLMYRGPVAA